MSSDGGWGDVSSPLPARGSRTCDAGLVCNVSAQKSTQAENIAYGRNTMGMTYICFSCIQECNAQNAELVPLSGVPERTSPS